MEPESPPLPDWGNIACRLREQDMLGIVKMIHLMDRRSPFSSTDHGESQRWRQDSAEGGKWTLSIVLNSGAPESWNSVASGYLELKLQDLDLHVFLMRGLPGGMTGEFY